MLDPNDATIEHELSELPRYDAEVDLQSRVRRLEEVLAQLSPKCRAALLLQYRNGLSYEDIGARLGVSRNMVKKYLALGLAHCRRRMARWE
jgi:RNA polymerase sigma factor (sigma-70 family)